jgi:hypothetical protein
MNKIKVFIIGAALTASVFVPAVAEARSTWT